MTLNPTLALLLSELYDGALAPEHRADLDKSGLTDATIRMQKIRSVPPDLIDRLLGFKTPKVVSAYLLPFPDQRGTWMNHIRLRVFPPYRDRHGLVKYLQPRGSGVRLYFPLATLAAVRHAIEPLYLIEGEKKSLAVAQDGAPAVGLCGIEGWHVGGSAALHPDLDDIGLTGRIVHIIPDADYRVNPAVSAATRLLGDALRDRGAARVTVVHVPAPFKGIDDYLASQAP